MNELTQRKIRFSDAARAIGVKPKTLRNWLQRNEIQLVSDYSAREWTEFTIADIAVLSVMRELVRYGMKVDAANEIACAEFLQKSHLLLNYREMPASALVAYLHPFKLFVWGEDEDGELLSAMIQDINEVMPSYPSFVVVRPGSVFGAALDRLDSGFKEN